MKRGKGLHTAQYKINVYQVVMLSQESLSRDEDEKSQDEEIKISVK